jgi:hypothetical protein
VAARVIACWPDVPAQAGTATQAVAAISPVAAAARRIRDFTIPPFVLIQESGRLISFSVRVSLCAVFPAE